MKTKEDFHFIMDVRLTPALTKGLVLPWQFSDVLSRTFDNLLLLDYNKKGYRVLVEHLENGLKKIYGPKWEAFLKFAGTQPCFQKLCFKMIGKYLFEVQLYDSEDLENRIGVDGEPYNHSALLTITSSTFKRQRLPQTFLISLNGTAEIPDTKHCKLIGPEHETVVDVLYDIVEYPMEGSLVPFTVAAGFEGENWEEFCSINNFRNGYTLKVTNMLDGSFSVDVFRKEGICVQSLESGEHQVDGHVGSSSAAAGQELIVVSSESESFDAGYETNSAEASLEGTFVLEIQKFNVKKRWMTVPKDIVRKFLLQKYHRVDLHFRNHLYHAQLKIRWDI